MDERGFTFPVSLSLLLLVSLFLLILLNQYLTEKQFVKQIEEFEQNRFYFFQSMLQVERMIIEGEQEQSGRFPYEHGTVYYNIDEIADNLFHIELELERNNGASLEASFYFDEIGGKTIGWIEK